MNSTGITPEEFVTSAKHFIQLSDKCHDSWSIYENKEIINTYIKKEEFVNHQNEHDRVSLYRAEYVIFYNLSYGVPSFSFNVWDNSGKLLTLEEVQQIMLAKINEKEFYSIITQQEHPVLHRPYFVIHPCHTAEHLAEFKQTTKNIIVTFLGIITPLIQINLSLEYGL